jgi:hypothetical protein
MRATTVAQVVFIATLVTNQAIGKNIAVDANINIDTNVAVDAVTRATTYHSHEGDVDVLTDGLVPDADEAAPAFFWNTQGILVFEWSVPLPLTRVRVYVGEIGNDYVITTFVGGRLDDAGTLREPQGLRTASVEEHSRATGGWIDSPLPEGTMADNIELLALGPIELYEVQIQVPAGETAVRALRWSELKSHSRDGNPRPRHGQ